MRHPGAQSLTIVGVAACSLALASEALSQRLPFPPGATVRIAHVDGVTGDEWVIGTVMRARRDFLHLDPLEPGAQFAFRLDDSMRLQVRSGRNTNIPLGAGVGLAAGAVSGATFLATTVGSADDSRANAIGAVTYGAIGALLGAFISSRVGSPRWVDVTIVNGRVPAAPLTVPQTVARSFNKPYYWTRFDPTLEDFRPFFEEHVAVLHPIEGLWKHRTAVAYLAIVRDPSFEGFEYVAFEVPTSRRGRNRAEWGQMVMALGGEATDTTYALRFSLSPQQWTATLEGGVLSIDLPGGRFEQWIRTVP